LIIAGVVKAGTTSVFTYLSQHPEVCSSSVKEAQYFSGYRYGKPVKPIDTYSKLFSRWAGEKWVMEATPGYFEGGQLLAGKIRDIAGGDIRVLIILREPVDRLLSFFRYKKSELKLARDLRLDEYISRCERMPDDERRKQENDTFWGIDGGFYSNYLPGWFEVFGDSVKVMFFDALKEDRRRFMSELCDWLGIDDAIYDRLAMQVENRSQNYRSARLQQFALWINRKLEVFFRRRPRLKRALRNLYFLANENPNQEEYSRKTLDYLHSVYRPYNRKLATILRSRHYDNLPAWLSITPDRS